MFIRNFLFSAIVVLGFISCDNELDLISESKDIPIVYGLLSNLDTAQYIRLERAFIDANTSALELAKNPDLLYYPNATVSIVRQSDNVSFNFNRVDGNLEGYLRDAGVFAQAPNYLYKLHSSQLSIKEGETYKLLINTGEEDEVSATTKILESPLITRPSSSSRLDFDYISDVNIKWRGDDNAKIATVRLVINIDETINNGPLTPKSVIWNIADNIEDDELFRKGVDFYTFLGGELTKDPSIKRVLRNIDVIVDTGGMDILDYIKIGQANLGVTSSQDVPKFTNLSRGLGIFSSKSTAIRESILVTSRTLDSLRVGQYTKDLNFN